MRDDPPYRVEPRDDGFAVVGLEDREILSCGDESSARHYADLLNRGWKAGYRQGYRDGRGFS